MIEFEIPIPPVAKERARFSRHGTYTPARTREFEKQVCAYAKRYAPDILLDQPLKLYCEFHLPRPRKPKFNLWPAVRPDNDNFLKALMDSCNGLIWRDDSLICHVDSKKVYALGKPKIVVRVEELNEPGLRPV